jgi:hypothetical protein
LAGGHDTEMPEKVLRVLQETLTVAQGHRDLVLGEIAAEASRRMGTRPAPPGPQW